MKFFDAIGRGVLLIVGSTVLIGAAIVSCQTSSAPKYTPNEVQMLKLQVKQKDAQNKRLVLNQAQAEFQAAYGALMDEENAIKKENKWPDTLLFDPDKLIYSEPPKAVPAAAPTPSKK